MADEKEILQLAAIELGLTVIEGDNQRLKQLLVGRVNDLIKNDFNRLVSILYRLDINEKKLKFLLEENASTDAAVTITDLIIEREWQKMQSRKQNKQQRGDIPEEESW